MGGLRGDELVTYGKPFLKSDIISTDFTVLKAQRDWYFSCSFIQLTNITVVVSEKLLDLCIH